MSFFTLVCLFFSTQNSYAEQNYVFPVANCTVKYGKHHHDYPATYIQANKDCAYVAPIAGVIDEVIAKDIWSGITNKGEARGGLVVSIMGVNGVARSCKNGITAIIQLRVTNAIQLNGKNLPLVNGRQN